MVAATAIAIIVLVVVGAAVLCGNKQKLSASAFGQTLLKSSEGLDEVKLDVAFDPDKNQLDVKQKMLIQNRWNEDVEQIVLRTYANAFLLQDTSPAATEELFDMCYPNGFVPGGMIFNEVLVDGEKINYQLEDKGKTVMVLELKAPLKANQNLEVDLEYQVTVPNSAYRFGYGEGMYQLGNVFPTLAVYEQGNWRKDEYISIGDPFYSACVNYDVTLQVPKGYHAAASGYGEETVGDNNVVTYRYQAPAMRDFALVISENTIVKQSKTGDVIVTAVGKDSKTLQKMLEYGKKALECFETLFGPYPYQQLTLVQANFPLGGMEYPGLVMIGDKLNSSQEQAFEWIVAHEVAHQWWYGVVGSDQYNQPWQDEALCEYSLLEYVNHYYGSQAKEDMIASRITTAMRTTIPRGVTPGSPVDYFGNLSEYSVVVYQRGAMVFLMLEEALGEEKLNQALQAYYQEYAFKIAAREDFEQSLLKTTGQDWSALLVDFLDTEYTY